MGNAALRPETVTQYNVGITYELTRKNKTFNYFRIGADAYYNYVTDKIISWPQGPQFRWTTLNLGKVDIRE